MSEIVPRETEEERQAINKRMTNPERIDVLAVVGEYLTDVDGLMAELEFEYSHLDITRDDARHLIAIWVAENESDQKANAPSGTNFLVSKTDTMLRDELDRLQTEQRVMQKIAKKPPGMDYVVRWDKTRMWNPMEARVRLERILDRILEIKKVLTEDVKASSKEGDTNFNFQLNMGEVLTTALDNIDSSPSVKQVSSTSR